MNWSSLLAGFVIGVLFMSIWSSLILRQWAKCRKGFQMFAGDVVKMLRAKRDPEAVCEYAERIYRIFEERNR